MKISNRKLKRKEDAIVFKALLRCIKEDKNTFSCCMKKYKTFDNIIHNCYCSRERHPAETFQTNIFYWPSDCGLFSDNAIKLLYVVLLINGLNLKKLELRARLIELHSFIVSSIGIKGFNLEPYFDYIINAFIKIGFDKDEAELKANSIILTYRAAKEKLPF